MGMCEISKKVLRGFKFEIRIYHIKIKILIYLVIYFVIRKLKYVIMRIHLDTSRLFSSMFVSEYVTSIYPSLIHLMT